MQFHPSHWLFLLTVFITVPALQAHAQPEIKSDWSHQVELPAGETPIELFNGKDLEGWKGFEKYFSVVDGMIRARNDERVKMSTFLFTEQEFRNYRLLLEVKQTMGDEFSTMHSAVASGGKHVKNWGGDYGFEGPILMFCHDWGIWGAGGRKRIFPPDQKVPMADVPWEKKGNWNQLEILVIGDRMRMVSNGQLMVDHTEEEGLLKKCALGLQMHNEKRTQEFFFRGLVAVDNPTDVTLTQRTSALQAQGKESTSPAKGSDSKGSDSKGANSNGDATTRE